MMKLFAFLLWLPVSAFALDGTLEHKLSLTQVLGDKVSTHHQDSAKNIALTTEGKINLNNDWRLIADLEIKNGTLDSNYNIKLRYVYLQNDINNQWSLRAGRVRHTFGMYPESDSIHKPFEIPARPQSIYRPAFESLGSTTDGGQVAYTGDIFNVRLAHGRMVVDSSEELMGVYYQYPAGTFVDKQSTSTALNLSTHCIPKFEGRVDMFYWDYKFVPDQNDPFQMLANTNKQTTLATIVSGRYYTDYDLDFIAEWIDTQGGGNAWDKFTQLFGKIRAQGYSFGAIKTYEKFQVGTYFDRFDVVDDKSQLMTMTGLTSKRFYSSSYNVYATYKFNRSLYISTQYINRDGSATENVNNNKLLHGESVLIQLIKMM